MKLDSAEREVERLDLTERGVPRDEPAFEWLAVARLGVFVGVSYCWFDEARVVRERSGVALSVSS